MATKKFSAFAAASVPASGDIVVGLDSGVNSKFTVGTTPAASSVAAWDASKNLSANGLLVNGSSSGVISILPQAAAGTFNFNLPITAGTSGYFLTSAGGGSSAMTWTAPITGFTWAGVSGTTQAAAVNMGYIIQNASQTTVTLPATAAIGATVQVQGLGAAGWILAANTGQTIQLGATVTTSGGTLTSAARYDCVQVVCIVANTTWAVSFVLSSNLVAA